ncbi:MAG: type II secretion system F family protein [Myxococcales bacterium]|nr:type II secretion system protein GspF [Myxococcales bacterium]HIK86521.1 type II secretion system protein GspF [Myxococcales bacterium]
MPVYAYKGVNQSGRPTKGTISAEGARAARVQMRAGGVFLTEITETNTQAGADGKPKTSGRGLNMEINLPVRIPPMEIAMSTRQLATLVGAGVPLVESLSALVEQTEHRALKGVWAQVRDRVNEGGSLAEALSGTGRFDNLYTSMVRAGEASGALEAVLARVADYLEDQVRLNNRVLSILTYPLFMLAFAAVVVGVMVTLVLPQITELLISQNLELPWYTAAVIGFSDLLRGYWWLIIVAIVGLVVLYRSIWRTKKGRFALDRFWLGFPVVGRVIRFLAIARFTRTLGSLLASSVNIVQALNIARHVANNAIFEQAADAARDAILEGAPLANPLRQSGEFPPLVTTMVEVGERSGDLEGMLIKVADTYEEQVETSITRLTSLLEPVLILVMVGVVGIIIMAVLMPMLQLTESIG